MINVGNARHATKQEGAKERKGVLEGLLGWLSGIDVNDWEVQQGSWAPTRGFMRGVRLLRAAVNVLPPHGVYIGRRYQPSR